MGRFFERSASVGIMYHFGNGWHEWSNRVAHKYEAAPIERVVGAISLSVFAKGR